jgi:hypothetical protein
MKTGRRSVTAQAFQFGAPSHFPRCGGAFFFGFSFSFFVLKSEICTNFLNQFRERLVHFLVHLLVPRRLQVTHRALHIGVAEPLLHRA